MHVHDSLFRQIVEGLPNPVFTKDRAGRYVYANPATAQVLQLTREKIVGHTDDEIFGSESARRIQAIDLAVIETGLVQYNKAPVPSVNGPLVFESTKLPLRDAENTIVGVFGISHDVTEREAAARAMLEAKEAAEAATSAKTQFLANMSHEIRTPLNAVVGLTDLLAETALDAEQADYVSTLKASAEALMTIVNDVLDISRIESGFVELEVANFDIEECVRGAIDVVATAAARKGLGLVWRVEPSVPRALAGDAGRLRQVLMNLLGNAVKFTAAGTVTLDVSAWSSNGVSKLIFTVQDTGIGIPAAKLDRLFETFSQVDASTTRVYGGSGLGLAISMRIVEMMGGQLWVESEPGRGSTFCFTVDVARAERAPAREEPCDAGLPDGLRILLAEDNPVNQMVAVRLLERLGCRADVAANGVEALAALDRSEYDIVLLDVQMPEMDGLEAARRIRERWPAGTGPRLIALTANATSQDRAKCLAAGMDDYVPKPVRLEALKRALVEAATPARAPDPLDAVRVAELCEMSGGDMDFVAQLVDLYIEDAPARLAELRAATHAGSLDLAARHAHGLKGSAGNVGAAGAQALAQRLEAAAKEGDVAKTLDLADALDREIERVGEARERLVQLVA